MKMEHKLLLAAAVIACFQLFISLKVNEISENIKMCLIGKNPSDPLNILK